ncbi:uncharacterized protein EV154DRAFT_487854 [Mucor mucedo]|uniref:uncharacterized protein n=1 Tax=Mucor mucedo TaxID=29922 RepID=UPI00221E5E05|nr:uncharacterized protein EV154DRAFT_487854 [Mucor mucedo]KAI7870094.1 hypothetical protein EV154DRAFT_487854 [Mucor mucedo]
MCPTHFSLNWLSAKCGIFSLSSFEVIKAAKLVILGVQPKLLSLKKKYFKCPQYFELEPHLSDRFTDNSWVTDTGTIQDKPFNKETFIASIRNEDKKSKKKNKKQKKTKTPVYDELMERFEIETGANGSNAGGSESGSNTTNDSEKSTSVVALEACNVAMCSDNASTM